MGTFDPETLERWRTMKPEIVYIEARTALHKAGARSSEDFIDAFEELVNEGILTWEGIEDLDGR